MQRVRYAPKAACFSALIALFAVSAQAQAPAAPVLSAPAEEASRVLSAQFSWGAVSGAETYQLQVSTAYNFASPVVNDSGFSTTTRNAGPFALSTVYFWRVRGKNASGDGAWSTIRTFTSPVLLPAPDSGGWIKVFRGTNTGDFFTAPNNSTPPGRTLGAFPGGPYSVTGDTIKVTGSPAGQFYFKQPFSRYKVRYQIRFPNFTGTGNGGTGNCGMLLHVQAHDAPTMGFPRSVEAQGDPTQGMGQLWPIGDVWVTVKAKTVSGRMQYDTASPEVDYGGANWNSRVVVGINGWGFPTFASQQQDGWVNMEAHVYGSDSIIHLVNGVERIRYRNPRVSSGGTVNNVSKMLAKGLIAWQSEGTAVWYRNLEVKPLPGDSMYTVSIAGKNPKAGPSPAAAPRLLLNGSASPRFDVPGASGLYDLKGRNLGPRDARGPVQGAAETSSQENNP
jgi:hypothetical protein